MFKGGSILQNLEKQWPPSFLKFHQWDEEDRPKKSLFQFSAIWGATLLKDERFLDRFAFVMERRWGDLWMLIDHQMMQFHNQGPPFTPHQVVDLMGHITYNMKELHRQHPPILHKDLKAANVLVWKDDTTDGPHLTDKGDYFVSVVEFEYSVGVVGTNFWRAPKIFQQLKDKVPMCDLKFTNKCNVYGMMCYELVTSCVPFEDYEIRPKEGPWPSIKRKEIRIAT